MRGELSRADLLRLIHGRSAKERDRFAALLGYERISTAARDVPPQGPQPPAVKPLRPMHDERPPVTPSEVARPVFWRPVARDYLAASDEGEVRRWWSDARRVGDRATAARPHTSPRAERLLNWPRILGFLRHHLVTVRPSQAVDEHRLVRQLAAGSLITTIPRRRLRRWPPSVILLLDCDEAAYPLRADFESLATRLEALLGNRLTIIRSPVISGSEHDAPLRWLQAAALSPETATISRWLLASDLSGRTQGAPRRLLWRTVIEWFDNRALALTPIALIPAPPVTWLPGLDKVLAAAYWDRQQPLRIKRSAPADAVVGRVPGDGRPGPSEDHPGVHDAAAVEQLLAMLSMTWEARPRLLRKLRQLLPAGSHDVSTELGLWNHPAVVRRLPVCFLHPGQRVKYQERFQAFPDELRAATARIIVEDHVGADDHVRDLDEALFAPASGGHEPVPGFIGDTVRTLTRESPREGERRMLLNWAEQVVTSTAPQLLSAYEPLGALRYVVQGERARRGGGVAVQRDERFAYLYAGRGASKFCLWQRGTGWLAQSGEPPAGPGSPVATLESCDEVLRIEAVNDPMWRAGEPPPWACTWGRDAYGPWVEWELDRVADTPLCQRFRSTLR